MKKIISLIPGSAALAIIASCSATPTPPLTTFFNTAEFPGLVVLAPHKSQWQLDYSLDTNEGKTLHFSHCSQVTPAMADVIISEQYPLLQLLQSNCAAATAYLAATPASTSYFPAALSADWISALPTSARPNLGGDNSHNSDTTLGKVHTNLSININSATAADVIFPDDLVVRYILMARADIDRDGMEDWLVRMDWHITAAGHGAELIMLSKTGCNQPMITVPIISTD
jgi:hypothetical protein